MSSAVNPERSHTTVLLREAVAALRPHPGGAWIDGTFGGGGHTRRLVEECGPDTTIFAIDADPEAIDRAHQLAVDLSPAKIVPIHGNAGDLEMLAKSIPIPAIDGFLMDLGLSSFQLDEQGRGFAFRSSGPLDMRFDTSQGVTAADIVNTWGEQELAHVIWRYGEEKRSRRIAQSIVRARPLPTTDELASVIERAVGGRRGQPIHPATRTFQALRIAVNNELDQLERALGAAVGLLKPSGRLVIIAFHSLEDRIVKQFLARESVDCICPPDQPVCTCDHKASVRRIGKPIRPDQAEVAANPRSRSAIMRVAERLP